MGQRITNGSARDTDTAAPPKRATGHSKATRAAVRGRPTPASGTPRTHPVRVLCVDDHAVLVEGLKAQFAIDGGIEIVGSLASAERLEDAVQQLHPEVVILDIEMPGPDAFEMTNRMRQVHPDVRVVVLSAHIRDAFISAAFRAGVSAYFAKSDDLGDIVRGIYEVSGSPTGMFLLGPKVSERCRPVADGRSDHNQTVQKKKRDSDTGRPSTRLDSLTPREAEILRLVGKGLSRTDIAAQLCRSAKTVDAHQDRMLKKLGLSTRSELMRLAIREGFAQA